MDIDNEHFESTRWTLVEYPAPQREVLDVVLTELAATEQAIKDDPLMTGDAADYAADIVRVLSRHFLGEDR